MGRPKMGRPKMGRPKMGRPKMGRLKMGRTRRCRSALVPEVALGQVAALYLHRRKLTSDGNV
jgi:hypothetical protein